jgi:hypothetical protein
LAERLFVPQERWGWEYVKPLGLAESPEVDAEPVWSEPEPADVSDLEQRRAHAKKRMPKRLGITALLWIGISFGSAGAGLLVLLVGVAVSVAPLVVAGRQIKARIAQTHTQRGQALARHQHDLREWKSRVAAHDAAETARRAAALLWHPLEFRSGPTRIDVFGGTGDGWASLLATLGTSLVPSGQAITVLDLSEQHVAGELAELVASRGQTVTQVELPLDTGRLNVLDGVAPDEVADLLAQAVHTLRKSGEQVDLRALDTDLLETVAKRLNGSLTFRRLVAGLHVLRRTYDTAAEGPLTDSEVTELTVCVDALGQTDRIQQELQFLISTLSLLTKDETEPISTNDKRDSGGWWTGRSGLQIIRTAHNQHRLKDFLDRVVFHRLLHELRGFGSGTATGENVLVVAGADAVGLEGLEALARECRRVGVRLILLLERLRGDFTQLLGSSGSAALLMQLGNAQDANAAAEFIGKGHKFVLSQVTTQVGNSFAAGTGESTSTTEGESNTTGTSETTGTTKTVGRSWNGSPGGLSKKSRGGSVNVSRSKSLTKSESFTSSRSKSWQNTVNHTETDSTTDGTTEARVYEYAIEPTRIQSLPATAFVLVENPASGRRVVLGDCNPGIALLDKVSTNPRTD